MPDEPADASVSFVPTPIGNLADITLRGIDTLQSADLIACEDTRHSRKLLRHYEIDKPLTSLHDHNESRKSYLGRKNRCDLRCGNALPLRSRLSPLTRMY